MKACVLESIGNLIYKDVVTPEPKAGEVLLKVMACGICSSDIPRVFKTGTYHFPTIPGHELSGQVIALGENVPKSWLGKRVAVFPLLPCFSCPSCSAQEYARCENYSYFGSRCDGGFAENLAVPIWNLIEINDQLSYNVAALCEPTSVALHSLGKISTIKKKRLLVIGSGTIGILVAMLAQIKGADVTIAGRGQKKLDYISQFGLNHSCTISEVQELDPFDIVMECVGSNDSIISALSAVARGGEIVFTGNPASDIELPKAIYWKILRNELTIHGTWNSSYSDKKNDWKDAIAFLTANQTHLSKLITHRFPLSECGAAFDTAQSKDIMSIKVMFTQGEQL